eukprot:gb/GECH01014231.1/.p1 GENE.gb/GECH01014231.1/~~gb/GECH01014231.1/.p1  ORF type:complete len:972 (+),score=173.25 gb/GECH01014231.1/:1-2916(+)
MNPEQVVSKLESALSPNLADRKSGEKWLTSALPQNGFTQVLFQILAEPSVSPDKKQLAAIMVKNAVRNHWEPKTEEQEELGNEDKEFLKDNIVELLVQSPTHSIQKQAAETLSLISRSDFPQKWPNLLKNLVTQLQQTEDLDVIQGVLLTAHNIFKKYRFTAGNEDLYREIAGVLSVFQEPLLQLYQQVVNALDKNTDNKEVLPKLVNVLLLLLKIFYSLNWQTIPEWFEDHRHDFFPPMQRLLSWDNPIVDDPDEEDDPTPLVEVKRVVCEIITLYMQKYEEEFEEYYEEFAKQVWNLLTGLKQCAKNDMLAVHGMNYLSTISRSVAHGLFQGEESQKIIVEQVVIPNMRLREEDVDTFEDDPQAYVRRDVEGSNSMTRRQAAWKLVQGLCLHYAKPVTKLCFADISTLLDQFQTDPENNWVQKDVATYLVTALTVQGYSESKGATQLSGLIDVADFLQTHILPDLAVDASQMDNLPILRASALRFMTTFRNHLPAALFDQCFRAAITFLDSKYRVLHTYAARAVERTLLIIERKNIQIDMSSAVEPILTKLFAILQAGLTQKEYANNEYVMKAVMRMVAVGRQLVTPYTGQMVSTLNQVLETVCKNPADPSFNHYLFETYAAMVQFHTQSIVEHEQEVFDGMLQILHLDVQDFFGYAFQVLACLLDHRPKPVPDRYTDLIPALLDPESWKLHQNIPALSYLLNTFIRNATNHLMADPKRLEGVLGVFQKLVLSRTYDIHGFQILNATIESVEQSHLMHFFPQILNILFTRLMNKRTGQFGRCLILFLSLFVVCHGGSLLVENVENLQSGLFANLMDSVWLSETQRIVGQQPRKLVAVSLTKLLTETDQLLQEQYVGSWQQAMLCLVKLFEMPEETPEADKDLYQDDDDIAEVSSSLSGYRRLQFAPRQDRDHVAEYTNIKQYFAVNLNKLLQTDKGRQMWSQARSGLYESGTLEKIQAYMHENNLPADI